MKEQLFKGDIKNASLGAEEDARKLLVKFVGGTPTTRRLSDIDPSTGRQIIVYEWDMPSGIVREKVRSRADGGWDYEVQYPDEMEPVLEDSRDS